MALSRRGFLGALTGGFGVMFAAKPKEEEFLPAKSLDNKAEEVIHGCDFPIEDKVEPVHFDQSLGMHWDSVRCCWVGDDGVPCPHAEPIYELGNREPIEWDDYDECFASVAIDGWGYDIDGTKYNHIGI
jgi:hypothetical protein